jgi:predicted Zn finger-like uncharacterized protein
MIVRCRKCGTRYRFDETLLEGDGEWVRCSRCQNVFFQENPAGPDVLPDLIGEEEKSAEVSEAEASTLDDVIEHSEEGDRKKKRGVSIKRILLLVAAILLIAGGLVFWFMPQAGKGVLESVPGWNRVAEFLGIEKPKMVMDGGIDFLNVRDKFVKNWLGTDIMVISGTAVNRNLYPLSKIKVRAKLLDATGQTAAQAEAYAGNLLTDEELVVMSEREIMGRLSVPEGRDVRNADIAPQGKIPFVIVLANPPKNAVEFFVEMAFLERK